MAIAKPPAIAIRGIRQTLPSGYMLGRTSAGEGPAQLIPIGTVGAALVASGVVTGPGNPAPQEWNAGTVNALGSGLSISTGTLEYTAEWTAGTVSAVGTGLTIAAGGTLEATGSASEWTAGTVTAIGTGLSIISGATTWNPSESGGGTLSNGNLTIAGITGSGTGTTLATTSQSTGKYYWEATVAANGSTAYGGWAIGVANIGQNLAHYLGQDSANGIGLYAANGLYLPSGTGSTAAVSHTVCVAVDFGAQLIWTRTDGGNWNNSGTANPTTGVGGISIAAITGPYYPAFTTTLLNGSPSGGTTVNFGATSFAQTAPSGFSAYNASASETLTPNWQAGTVSALGTGLAINSGTLNPNYSAGALNTIGSGLSLTSGTLTATGSGGTVTNVATSGAGISGGPITGTGTLTVEWNAGTVSALGTGLAINSGSLTPNYQAGTLTAIGSGLSLTSGTLTATSSGGTVTNVATSGAGISGGPITGTGTLTVEWNAGTVSATGANLAISSGTLNVVGNTSGSVVAGNIGELKQAIVQGNTKTATVTFTNASPTVVTWTGHGFTSTNGIQPIQFVNAGGALPSGISSNTTYYIDPSSITTNTFKIATTIANAIAGTDVNTSSTGTGTQTTFNSAVGANGVNTDVCGLNLGPGVWQVWGAIGSVNSASSSITDMYCWVNTVSALPPTISGGNFAGVNFDVGISYSSFPVGLASGVIVVNQSGTAPVFLTMSWAVNNPFSVYGTLNALRVA